MRIDDFIHATVLKERLSPLGCCVLLCDETTSTNDDLKALVRSGASEGVTLKAALRQTGGRGTRGRIWEAPECALLFSTALPLATGALSSGVVSIAVGAGVVHAARGLGIDIALKWPNDVWVAGGKAGGILCEAVRGPDGGEYLVAGIGLNLAFAPGTARRRTTNGWRVMALADAGEGASALACDAGIRTDFLASCVSKILLALSELEENGPGALCAEWSLLDAFAGRLVRFRTANAPDEIGSGFNAGLTEEGALRLLCEDGSERLLSGADALVSGEAA